MPLVVILYIIMHCIGVFKLRMHLANVYSFQIQTRIANEKYLRAHTEVEVMLSHFLRLVLFGFNFSI